MRVNTGEDKLLNKLGFLMAVKSVKLNLIGSTKAFYILKINIYELLHVHTWLHFLHNYNKLRPLTFLYYKGVFN